MAWSLEDVKDQNGRVAIVTGANSGLGYEVTKALALKNFKIVMAVRNIEKGERAKLKILETYPKAFLEVLELDIANLKSVGIFAQKVIREYKNLDLLINNAGVMNIPFKLTADGFETQFGGNHLGHFALTLKLIKNLNEEGRVVTVSSFIAKQGKIDFDNLNGEKGYQPFIAYAQSKLANLMFGLELAEKLTSKSSVRSFVAHPGYANTNLQTMGQEKMPFYMKIANAIVAQSAYAGALPILRAALDVNAKSGEFYGPNFLQLRGDPVKIQPYAQALDKSVRGKLWEISEKLTGVSFS